MKFLASMGLLAASSFVTALVLVMTGADGGQLRDTIFFISGGITGVLNVAILRTEGGR